MTSEGLRFFKIGLEGAVNEDDLDVFSLGVSGAEDAGELGSIQDRSGRG